MRTAAIQMIKKRAKITLGIINTYVKRINKNYTDTEWWDKHFYTRGVSDPKSISPEKSLITALYHYNSVEMQILKHLYNYNISLTNKSVLDLGSGAGHWLDFYQTLGSNDLAGIDVSLSSYKHLEKKYVGNSKVTIYHGKINEILRNASKKYDLINAVGIMFHIVDDNEWKDTLKIIASRLEKGGTLVISGHFGLLGGLNIQIDEYGVNKRLRSKKHWINTLKGAGFTNISVYKNNAYLWIQDTLPENNVLIATKQ